MFPKSPSKKKIFRILLPRMERNISFGLISLLIGITVSIGFTQSNYNLDIKLDNFIH